MTMQLKNEFNDKSTKPNALTYKMNYALNA